MAKDLKRSVAIAGHRTSISLEPEFWAAFSEEAHKLGRTVPSLVGEIDRTRGDRNLSAAIRVWVLARLKSYG